ncbi:MAG TPA: hypothetical protein VMV18_03400, partial [bacterium]|nr:hypothetical protein [bacterium]
GDEISYFETSSPYLGTSFVASAGATLKPVERAAVGVSYYREIFSRAHSLAPNDFNAQGVYDATVARVNAQVFLTRYLSARVITQWTTTDWKLSVSTLIGYRPGPGQIFYVGYQDAAPGKPGIDTTQDRALFAKASWLFGN